MKKHALDKLLNKAEVSCLISASISFGRVLVYTAALLSCSFCPLFLGCLVGCAHAVVHDEHGWEARLCSKPPHPFFWATLSVHTRMCLLYLEE